MVCVCTCEEECRAQTPLVQQLSSQLKSSSLFSSSAWTWPSLSWLAQSSNPWSHHRGQCWAHHPPPALLRCETNPCWPHLLPPKVGLILGACGCHSKPSYGRWKRCHWPQSLWRAPSSYRGPPAGHRWRGRLCNSWLCDTGCRRLNHAACKCSRWASSVQEECAQYYRSAPERLC